VLLNRGDSPPGKAPGLAVAAPMAALSCPATDPGDATNPPSPGLADKLVPDDPTTGTICRYHGRTQPETPGALAQTATVPDERVADLAAALNQGHRVIESARYSCPVGSSGSIRVVFAYPDASTVEVWVDLRGCQIASNGPIGVFISDDALRQLTDLVG
jgi:hypothetical protein